MEIDIRKKARVARAELKNNLNWEKLRIKQKNLSTRRWRAEVHEAQKDHQQAGENTGLKYTVE